MGAKFHARFEQLIRTAAITGVDQIVCGNRACQCPRYRITVEDGIGVLRCDDCGRVSVRFDLGGRATAETN